MLRKSTSIVVLVYGLVLVILGLLGYYKGHSLMSLIAGSGFGVLLVLSSVLMFFKQKVGGNLALVLTLMLTGMFAYRYTVTSKTLPAILAVLSGGMLLFLLARTAKWKK